MSDIAIRVEGLGKRYRIGERARYQTVYDSLVRMAGLPMRVAANGLMNNGARREAATENDHIWALKDVSFTVKQGDVVGVVGRNGAGKTTLLKIISRITEPTEGYAEMHGRIGSLLEVGAGFHPELTGRENIFLNGSILGMRRSEIQRKFDEIVAFSGIETFIDTPVKHYSRGMYVRLAFSVAAHLEPEVLLVDEVLSVGDAAFQKKCLGKMEAVSEQGRTVLFVSHSMPTVASLTRRCLWMDGGKVVQDGDTPEVVTSYLDSALAQGPADGVSDLSTHERTRAGLGGQCRFTDLRLLDSDGRPSGTFYEGRAMGIELTLDSAIHSRLLHILCRVFTNQGTLVTTLVFYDDQADLRAGAYRVAAHLPRLMLRPGVYRIDLKLTTTAGAQDYVEGAALFHLQHNPEGYENHVYREEVGVVSMDHSWSRLFSL